MIELNEMRTAYTIILVSDRHRPGVLCRSSHSTSRQSASSQHNAGENLNFLVEHYFPVHLIALGPRRSAGAIVRLPPQPVVVTTQRHPVPPAECVLLGPVLQPNKWSLRVT